MTNDKGKNIFMVGAFPPPVHGMASVNAEVRESLRRVGVEPFVIDVSAASLDRSFATRLGRLPKVVRGLTRLLFQCRKPGKSFYMSISGGLGQMYETLFLVVARFRRMRIYVHHHSFAYLDRPHFLTSVLTMIAGPRSLHITQSPGMKARLMRGYTFVRRVLPISNVVFMMDWGGRRRLPRKSVKTIGFISNVAGEKGIFEFLDLVSACEANALDLRATIAGPFQDSQTEQRVRQRIGELSTVEYLGPLYGEAKRDFFASIDALIFPTLYYNETEGIVNHEAMCQGVPVIAYGRGCIPEIIPPAGGLVVPPGDPFVPAALGQLRQWIDKPYSYAEASRSARERFACTLEENVGRWDGLLHEMVNGKKENQLGSESKLERLLSNG